MIDFSSRAAAAALAPDFPARFYVGYLDGAAVAAAEATLAGGVAGVYNVATRAAYRRRGLGAALVARALVDARAAGYRASVLEAAPDGVGVYTRLGFREYGAVAEYK